MPILPKGLLLQKVAERFRVALLCAWLPSAGVHADAAALAAGSSLMPAHLRCEYLVNPLCIDEEHPRLSWQVESSQRGQRQTAYRVLVASDEKWLGKGRGDLWDSGKVASDETTGIAYDGKALTSQQQCFWKVKVWDKDGKASEWSEAGKWSMGLLKARDWQAEYISFRDTTPLHKLKEPLFLPSARQYRKEFSADREVRRATI